jgi:hypothetical protein
MESVHRCVGQQAAEIAKSRPGYRDEVPWNGTNCFRVVGEFPNSRKPTSTSRW